MSLRLAAGAGIGLIGITLLTRFIGPANYGIFTVAHATLVYFITMTECGIGVYLIRLERDAPEDFHQALTLLALFSVVGILLGLPVAFLLEHFYGLREVRMGVIAMVLGLPLVHAVKVPMARLERALDYKRVAVIELVGNLAYYVVALPLAYRGAGLAAPIAGWWAQQLAQLVQMYQTDYRPRFIWRPVIIKRMVSFGAPYSVTQVLMALRDLVNPLVVGHLLGPIGVGYVALALKIVQQLGIVRTATARISVAAFARVQGEPARLARALTEGMFLQIIAVGPVLCAFSLIAPVVIPLVFGPKWIPVSQIYPWLAVATMITSIFQLHLSVLTVLALNYQQAISYLVRLLLLVAFAVLLVSRLGTTGFGIAELASLPLFCLLLHHWISARIKPLHYSCATVWLLAFSLPLFAPYLGNLTWLSLSLPLLWNSTRRELFGLLDLLRPRNAAGVP